MLRSLDFDFATVCVKISVEDERIPHGDRLTAAINIFYIGSMSFEFTRNINIRSIHYVLTAQPHHSAVGAAFHAVRGVRGEGGLSCLETS